MAHLGVSQQFVMLLFEVLTLKGGNFVPDATLRHCCVIKYECQDELNLGYWRESYMKVLQTKASLCILLSRFFLYGCEEGLSDLTGSCRVISSITCAAQ